MFDQCLADTFYYSNQTVGLKPEIADIYFNIYPNPATDYVNVELLSGGNIKRIEIINILGEIIEKLNYNSCIKPVLNIKELPCGYYIIKTYSESEVFTKKFIKKE